VGRGLVLVFGAMVVVELAFAAFGVGSHSAVFREEVGVCCDHLGKSDHAVGLWVFDRGLESEGDKEEDNV